MPSYSGVFNLQTQMQAIAAGNWTGLPRAIGSAYEGGFYAGQISTAGNGVADYNLVIGPKSSAQNASIQWKTSATGGDPTSVIDGPANSSTMNNATYPAAQFCEGLTIGGFSDWYMPAQNELDVCYVNLKPTTQVNNTSTSGPNLNAVPARASNYTSGNPAQTSASLFQTGNSEAFNAAAYWSSTQTNGNPGYGNYRLFDNGSPYPLPKNFNRFVRAIRRVAV